MCVLKPGGSQFPSRILSSSFEQSSLSKAIPGSGSRKGRVCSTRPLLAMWITASSLLLLAAWSPRALASPTPDTTTAPLTAETFIGWASDDRVSAVGSGAGTVCKSPQGTSMRQAGLVVWRQPQPCGSEATLLLES